MHKSGLTVMAALLSAALIFSGCGTTRETSGTAAESKNTTQDTEDQFFCEPMSLVAVSVTNEEVFETGFGAYQIEFEYGTENEVRFQRYAYFDIDWYLYVVDEELENVDLEMLGTLEPTIVNEGTVNLKEGQWVYVVCSCNSTNSEAPTNGFYEGFYFGP